MEYCFIKLVEEKVVEILVCDEAFANDYKEKKGYDLCIVRPLNVNINDIYRDGKFYKLVDGEEYEILGEENDK